MPEDEPLPSEPDSGAEDNEESTEETTETPEERPVRHAVPQFKVSTFVYTFLMVLGLVMVFDAGTRNAVAQGLAYIFNPLIGFGGHYLIATMAAAAVIEMLLQAVAYNVTTDWVKSAKVQKWSSHFRKAQMEALRSGKKDRVEALKPHQATLTRLSSEVSMAQLKGMAVTWTLLIAMYTWVYLFISGSTAIAPHVVQPPIVDLGGTSISLLHPLLGPISLWFVLFSLYTVPSSLAFRRFFKHYSLLKLTKIPPPAPSDASAA